MFPSRDRSAAGLQSNDVGERPFQRVETVRRLWRSRELTGGRSTVDRVRRRVEKCEGPAGRSVTSSFLAVNKR